MTRWTMQCATQARCRPRARSQHHPGGHQRPAARAAAVTDLDVLPVDDDVARVHSAADECRRSDDACKGSPESHPGVAPTPGSALAHGTASVRPRGASRRRHLPPSSRPTDLRCRWTALRDLPARPVLCDWRRRAL